MSRNDPPRAPTSPQEIRRKQFNPRFRGLDAGEVRSFLNALAGDLDVIQAQVTTLTQENRLLHDELEEVRSQPQEEVTDHAVTLLNQAQQLADALIDEAMESARDLLFTARSQQRDIVEQANEAAQGAVARATATAERVVNSEVNSEEASSEDIEYVRMFAKVAQVQFRAVLDALNEQVNRLDQLPEIEPPKRSQVSEAWARRGSESVG
jgi:DivIVA domain-containing protein